MGDGQAIHIFEDKWVPGLLSNIGKPTGNWQITDKVSSLIREGSWNRELILNTFNPYVAEEILKIPLSTQLTHDTQFWRFDSKGKYSVRDGYRLQMGLFSPPENQSEHSLQRWWSFLWSLSIPPKVHIFWWNVSQDIIPTSQNLQRHHVPIGSHCSLCNFAYDSTCHALFYCPAIKHLWKEAGYYHLFKAKTTTATLVFCEWMRAQLSRKEFEQFAVLSWAIWKEKQKFLHNEGDRVLPKSVTWSSALLSSFNAARSMEKHGNEMSNGRAQKNWKPADRNSFKMNVDACVNEQLRRYSVGAVVRDKQVRLLLAFGKQINQPISVVHGELLAIRDGINLLYEKNFEDVQVASDSLLAVRAVTATEEDFGYVGKCALEIFNDLKTSVVAEIIHESRSTNNVAHNVALFASSLPSSFVWMNGEFPSWVVELVQNNLN